MSDVKQQTKGKASKTSQRQAHADPSSSLPPAEASTTVANAVPEPCAAAQSPAAVAAGRMSYPASMKLSAIRDEGVAALVAQERQLRAELDSIRVDLRRVADAKDASLRDVQRHSSDAISGLSGSIDSLQDERESLFAVLDDLKATQNKLGQMRDEVKLLEFQLDPLHKLITSLQRKVADAQRNADEANARNAATDDASGSAASAAKRLDAVRAQLEEALAERRTKEDRRNVLRETLRSTGDVHQKWDATRKKLAATNEQLDALFAKRKQQSKAVRENGALDTLNEQLSSLRARRDTVSSRLDEVSTQIQPRVFRFPKQFRGDILGKQGATLAQLQQDFGVAINIDTPSRDGEAVLVGGADDIAACCEALQAIIDNADRCRQKRTMAFDVALTKGLIGTKGSNIEKLQTLSGANIKVSEGTITMTGTTEALDAAQQLINEYLDSSCRAEVPFDAALLDVVIGKGGATVRRVEQESGVKNIRVLRDERKIVISGSKDAVERAKQTYTTLLSSMSEATFTVRADDRMIRSVIGAGGKTIREITEATGALVNCGRDVITIRGSKDAVAEARRMIEELGRREEVRVAFPTSLYALLTSPTATLHGGSDAATGAAAAATEPLVKTTPIEAIKSATKVDQAVALARESVVVLRGRREAVQQAKSLLEELIVKHRPVSVKISVPEVLCTYMTRRPQQHEGELGGDVGGPKRRAAAAGDSFLVKLRDEFPACHIQLTPQTRTLEVSAATTRDVDLAVHAVNAFIERSSRCIRTVQIAPQRAGAVIGSGGKTIGAITQKTGTEIAVDKDTGVIQIFYGGGDGEKATAALDEAAAAVLVAAA